MSLLDTDLLDKAESMIDPIANHVGCNAVVWPNNLSANKKILDLVGDELLHMLWEVPVNAPYMLIQKICSFFTNGLGQLVFQGEYDEKYNFYIEYKAGQHIEFGSQNLHRFNNIYEILYNGRTQFAYAFEKRFDIDKTSPEQ